MKKSFGNSFISIGFIIYVIVSVIDKFLIKINDYIYIFIMIFAIIIIIIGMTKNKSKNS